MNRLKLIAENGKEILIMDLSSCRLDEAMQVLEQAKPLIRNKREKSMLVLTDVSNSRYNTQWADAIKVFARDNNPYVRASAVVGVAGLGAILVSAVQLFSGRVIEQFDNRADALRWLAEQ